MNSFEKNSIFYKKWADEKSSREQELIKLEKETSVLQEQLEGLLKSVPDYEKKLDEMPILLDTAMHEGEKEREEEMKIEQEHQTIIFRKDADAAIKNLEQKIASLNDDYEALLAEKETVQAKLDKAYDDSNKLYLQTVQSTGGIKILGDSMRG